MAQVCGVCGSDTDDALVECEVCESLMCPECTSNEVHDTCTTCVESENELRDDDV
jgi:hypothetical protein